MWDDRPQEGAIEQSEITPIQAARKLGLTKASIRALLDQEESELRNRARAYAEDGGQTKLTHLQLNILQFSERAKMLQEVMEQLPETRSLFLGVVK